MGLHYSFSVDLSAYDLFLVVLFVFCGIVLYILQAIPVPGTAAEGPQSLQAGDSSPAALPIPEPLPEPVQSPAPPVARRVYGEDRSVRARASALQSELS